MEKKITITLTEKEVKYILLAATALKYDASREARKRQTTTSENSKNAPQKCGRKSTTRSKHSDRHRKRNKGRQTP